MISAGNDIVSLSAVNVTRTKSPEFYSKIISPHERALYERLDKTLLPFEHFVWLLWSVKEAAFKYLQRLDAGLLFAPVKFVVNQIEIPPDFKIAPFGQQEFVSKGFDGLTVFNSVVSHKTRTLYAKTIICNEFISSVVNQAENFDNVHWGIKRIGDTSYKSQSSSVREFAVGSLQFAVGSRQWAVGSGQWAVGSWQLVVGSGRSAVGPGNLVIDKNEHGIPVLLCDGKVLDVGVSLSHHGEWVGFTLSRK